MYIVTGNVEGEEPDEDAFVMIDEGYLEYDDLGDEVRLPLENNVLSVDVVDKTQSTGGGTGGAAAGAALGFLIAGPAGTLLGAAAGSKKKGKDQVTISIAFVSGDFLVVRDAGPKDIATLHSFRASTAQYLKRKTATVETEASAIEQSKPTVTKKKKRSELPPIIKGRARANADLPDLAVVENLQSRISSEDSISRFVLKETLSSLIEYNTFKWRYFDEFIESSEECELISEFTVKRLGYKIRAVPRLKKLKEKYESNDKEINDAKYRERNSELKELQSKLRSYEGERKSLGFIHREKETAGWLY